MESLFENAYNYDHFVQGSEPEVLEKISAVRRMTRQHSDDYDAIMGIDKHVRILAYAENGCPDSILHLTTLNEMIAGSMQIELFVLPLKGNEEIIATYGTSGEARIPTLLFMNAKEEIKATFIELPKAYTFKQNLDPDDQALFEAYRSGAMIRQTIQEFLSYIERCM